MLLKEEKTSSGLVKSSLKQKNETKTTETVKVLLGEPWCKGIFENEKELKERQESQIIRSQSGLTTTEKGFEEIGLIDIEVHFPWCLEGSE